MKKQLITVSNLEEFICKESGKLYLDGSQILTPGAKDELTRRKVAIVYGSSSAACPPGCTCPKCLAQGNPALESLMLGVAAMLKQEYGVTDPAELEALSLQALEIIKKNI